MCLLGEGAYGAVVVFAFLGRVGFQLEARDGHNLGWMYMAGLRRMCRAGVLLRIRVVEEGLDGHG
jgi:hypothetical protein